MKAHWYTFSSVALALMKTGLLLRRPDRQLRHPQNACDQLMKLKSLPAPHPFSEEWYRVSGTLLLPFDVSPAAGWVAPEMGEQVGGTPQPSFLRGPDCVISDSLQVGLGLFLVFSICKCICQGLPWHFCFLFVSFPFAYKLQLSQK